MAYKVDGACVNIEFNVMGPIETNVYIIDDGETTFVVDPACDAERIVEALGNRKADAIVATHTHWDHVGALAALREATGARVIASAVETPYISGEESLGADHRNFEPCPIDEQVNDGDVVQIGAMKWRVILTPGHTPGGMCLFLDPATGLRPDGAPVLVSGDTLFAGTHGRTDFTGCDPAAMRSSLKRLAELPPETIVLPGHSNLTVIGREQFWLKEGGVVR